MLCQKQKKISPQPWDPMETNTINNLNLLANLTIITEKYVLSFIGSRKTVFDRFFSPAICKQEIDTETKNFRIHFYFTIHTIVPYATHYHADTNKFRLSFLREFWRMIIYTTQHISLLDRVNTIYWV